jgi:hypothetical protein
VSHWSVSEGSYRKCARSYENTAYVTAGTITDKILLRTGMLIQGDTKNEKPPKNYVILEQSEESYKIRAHTHDNTSLFYNGHYYGKDPWSWFYSFSRIIQQMVKIITNPLLS